VPTIPLPQNPSLEHLRKQAKTLLRAARSGAPEALDLLREFHPGPADPVRLDDAQLVVARRYGFPSWRRLRAHLDVVGRYTRSPHREPARSDDLAHALLGLGCLTYGADALDRQAEGRELLAAHPELAGADIWTAAAVGDVAAVRRLLSTDPGLVDREGGPHRWPPLLYLTYSRIGGESTVDTARLLLAHGADPNAGFLWEGLPSPFTALTGVFGEGDDSGNQPPHPAAWALARLLLDAGAEPNDAQLLYNRMFNPDNRHLELLLEHGLGRGTGGPWRDRLGPALGTPAQLVGDQLRWAARHDQRERVRLLLRHGVDPDSPDTGHPFAAGRSAYELAVLYGNEEIAAMLAAAGATLPPLDPVEEFVAACMRADRPAVDRLLVGDPALAGRVVAGHPDLVLRAAEVNRPDAVRLLVAVGSDVNARHRLTALHEAASEGRLDLVKVLLDLGADPAIRDTAYDATAEGWAEYNRQPEVLAYLKRYGAGAAHPPRTA
jgi:ankyrin repeat protein